MLGLWVTHLYPCVHFVHTIIFVSKRSVVANVSFSIAQVSSSIQKVVRYCSKSFPTIRFPCSDHFSFIKNTTAERMLWRCSVAPVSQQQMHREKTQLPSGTTSKFEAGLLEIVIFCLRCDGMGEIRSIVDTKFETLFVRHFCRLDKTLPLMPVGKPS